MMKFYIFFFIILFLNIHSTLFSQDLILQGYVVDDNTGEYLIGANIYLPLSERGATTNNQGFFSLEATPNDSILQISYVGYNSLKVPISSGILNYKLSPITLETVVVSSTTHSEIEFGKINIPLDKLESIPNLLGEPDVIKALSYSPGVSTGVEGSTGLYVRGGTPDQNLILLDGATVYNASHLFGFMSVFNSDALKNINLLKGNFPAKYGGRLSSVIDIAMKEGNNQEKNTELAIGLISSRLLTEGPIKKGKSSYMIAGRTAYLGLFALPLYFLYNSGKSDYYSNYLMYDWNAKVNFTLPNHGRLFFSTYLGNDNYISNFKDAENKHQEKLKWGNKTLSTRYHQPVGKKLFYNLLLNYNRFDYQNYYEVKETNENTYTSDNLTTIEEVAFKSQFDWNAAANHSFNFGIEGTLQKFQPVNIQLLENGQNTITPYLQKEKMQSLSLFIEDEWKLFTRFKLQAGLRASNYFVQNNKYAYLEPRASIQYNFNTSSLSASLSRMIQALHLLTTNSLGLNNDIWVPATDEVRPQEAWQATIGWGKKMSKYSIQIEAFYKEMTNQIDFRQGTNFFENVRIGWENSIEKNGIGKAYGLELDYKQHFPKGDFRLAYTLSKNMRQFNNINEGAWYPHRYDRTHDFSVTGSYSLNEWWTINTGFIYSTGIAVSIPDFIAYDFTGFPHPIYLTRNNSRMPNYSRLDISFKKDLKTRRKGRDASFSISLYNALGKRNPFYVSNFFHLIYEDNNYDNPISGYVNYKARTPFVFIPSFSYQIKL